MLTANTLWRKKKPINLMLKETLEMIDLNFPVLQMNLLKPREGMGLLYQGCRDRLSNRPRSYIPYYLIQDDTISRLPVEMQRPRRDGRGRKQCRCSRIHWVLTVGFAKAWIDLSMKTMLMSSLSRGHTQWIPNMPVGRYSPSSSPCLDL